MPKAKILCTDYFFFFYSKTVHFMSARVVRPEKLNNTCNGLIAPLCLFMETDSEITFDPFSSIRFILYLRPFHVRKHF